MLIKAVGLIISRFRRIDFMTVPGPDAPPPHPTHTPFEMAMQFRLLIPEHVPTEQAQNYIMKNSAYSTLNVPLL
jgi:hypothetical protein